MDTKPTIHLIDPVQSNPKISSAPWPVIMVVIVAIVAGIGTGYVVGTNKGTTMGSITGGSSSETEGSDISDEKAIDTAGVKDEKIFKDKAEGILLEGGIEGEGAFHLERPGGATQTAYLTSTTVDLSPFVGKKIRVWGKTFQGKKAGWLMDVGYVEVLR